MPNKLISTTFATKNLSSAVPVYTFTAAKAGNLRFYVFLDSVAGNGNYTVYLTRQLLGSGNAYPFEPKTVPAIASGETFFAAASLTIDTDNTDVFQIMVLGQAGDTSIGGKIQVWEDDYLRPVTAAQYATAIDSSGNASATLSVAERNSAADALLDRTNGIETSFTLRQALRLVLAASAAKLSGAATTTVIIRDINDSKNRITATVDASGNRSTVTTDVS